MLPAAHRLTEPAAFAETVRSGRRAGSPRLVVHLATPGDDVAPRIGLVVSRAVGNAVTRNRTKRRLRHRSADLVATLPPGSRLVVRALPPAAECHSDELDAELRRLVGRCLPQEGR